MKLVRWMRFTWDLVKLPQAAADSETHYRIRNATREDEEVVRTVITRAFSLDPDWADRLKQLLALLDSQFGEIFHHRDVPCLVVTHGSRIIGASAMTLAEDCESNLLSGPCILPEYRNRGIGSTLLHSSLAFLRDAGLARASGVTKEGVPAAKFIYTKFNSTGAPYDFEPQPVISKL